MKAAMKPMSLARQVDMVFRSLEEELRYLSSGAVFIQIRNDTVGKFGIRHFPLEINEEKPHVEPVMTQEQLTAFRKMAVEALEYKKNWTHGEVVFEFAIRRGILSANVQLESNYNMAAILEKQENSSL